MKTFEFLKMSQKEKENYLKNKIMYIQEFKVWNTNPIEYYYEIILPDSRDIFNIPYDNKGANHYKGVKYTSLMNNISNLPDEYIETYTKNLFLDQLPKWEAKEVGTYKELSNNFPEYFI